MMLSSEKDCQRLLTFVLTTLQLGELGLTEDESLYLVKRAMGKYVVPTAEEKEGGSDMVVKCLLIGGARAGKSSLLKAFSQEDFREEYQPTIGVEFNSLRFQSEEGLILKLQVWDTAGMDRFRAIVSAYYRGAAGFLAVFSLGSRASLEETLRIVREAQGQYQESCRCMCLVGTHADLPEPEVTEEEALQVAAENQCPYFAVSCKTGQHVHDPLFAWLDMFIEREVGGEAKHASLFLYQKLRTLVPSELEETMRDPVSRLVPVPFYVLPYKFRLAVHRGVGGLAQGIAAPRKGSCPRAHLQELQDMMPLCTSDGAVPNFLVRLLAVRGAEASPASSEPATEAAAAAAQSGVRDGLDQLVVDALTVYMSGWRMCNGGSAKMEETEPVSMLAASRQILERRGRSPAAVGRPQPRPKQGHDLLQEPKLRLGPDRSF
ncbi:RAB34 [Symbiodinium microadriaticum]|nr:RAB34 [Symbiodinium microadriaticum]